MALLLKGVFIKYEHKKAPVKGAKLVTFYIVDFLNQLEIA